MLGKACLTVASPPVPKTSVVVGGGGGGGGGAAGVVTVAVPDGGPVFPAASEAVTSYVYDVLGETPLSV